jgi:hypothetical protein
MTDEDTNVTFSDADYEAIEAAVLETARGRWFLQQFAKRNRNADTEVVLATLSRLEQTILDDKAMLAMERIRANLQEMATAITQTKGEIGLSPRDSENGDLSDFLDAMGQETGPGSEEEFQALAEQRIRRTFQTLRYLEGRRGTTPRRAIPSRGGTGCSSGTSSQFPHVRMTPPLKVALGTCMGLIDIGEELPRALAPCERLAVGPAPVSRDFESREDRLPQVVSENAAPG